MKKLLFFILAIAFLIRFIGVDSIPPGVNRDEASIGYTAYSILKTGKDEYGRFLPLSFQSFGDWKLPLYIYATIPFVAIFGLSDVSVKLVSILCGTASVALVYVLTKELILLQQHSKENNQLFEKLGKFTVSTKTMNTLALLSSLLLTFSPWHIHFSRIAYEANFALFLVLSATVIFLKSFHTIKFLPLSAILFSLSLYAYHGNHVFTPMFVFGLLYIFWQKVHTQKYFRIFISILFILSTIIFGATLLEANTTKLSGIGLFGDPTTIHYNIELPRIAHQSQNLYTKLFHNKIVYASEKFLENYLNAFSPDFLFIKGGGNHAHNIPNMGNMYLIDAPFLLLGLVYALTNFHSKSTKLILLWLLISPIAPSITKDAPHSSRMFMILPSLLILTAYGLLISISLWKNKHMYIFILCCAYTFFGMQYFDKYTNHFAATEWNNWGIQYKALSKYIQTQNIQPEKIIISDPETSPYIFLLFYSSYDPSKFQKEVTRYPVTSDGFSHVKSYGQFEFREITPNVDDSPNSITVYHTDEVTPNSISSLIPLYEKSLPNPVLYVSQ